jgi:hypothetical protein
LQTQAAAIESVKQLAAMGFSSKMIHSIEILINNRFIYHAILAKHKTEASGDSQKKRDLRAVSLFC